MNKSKYRVMFAQYNIMHQSMAIQAVADSSLYHVHMTTFTKNRSVNNPSG